MRDGAFSPCEDREAQRVEQKATARATGPFVFCGHSKKNRLAYPGALHFANQSGKSAGNGAGLGGLEPKREPKLVNQVVGRYLVGRVSLSRVNSILRHGVVALLSHGATLPSEATGRKRSPRRPPSDDAKALDSHAFVRDAGDSTRRAQWTANPDETGDPRPRYRALAKVLDRGHEEGAANAPAHLTVVGARQRENARRRNEDVAGHGALTRSTWPRSSKRIVPEA